MQIRVCSYPSRGFLHNEVTQIRLRHGPRRIPRGHHSKSQKDPFLFLIIRVSFLSLLRDSSSERIWKNSSRMGFRMFTITNLIQLVCLGGLTAAYVVPLENLAQLENRETSQHGTFTPFLSIFLLAQKLTSLPSMPFRQLSPSAPLPSS
jgi:hypothetical protein